MTEYAKGLVSVIIPAYNAAATLDRCLQSVAAQTYACFEVVLVDDGSTDSTPQIADGWAERDGRVRVVHKANSGVSAARNTALDAARGEWLTFVDADDYLAPDFLERLTEGHPCDLVVGGYHTVGAHEIREVNYPDTRAADAATIRALLESHLIDMTFLCPWGKLFRAALVRDRGLAFSTDMRIGEDVLFVWTYLSGCSTVALKPGQSYNYYTEPSDFKYILDGPAALDTVRRLFVPLDRLAQRFGMDTEPARSYLLNYYIWLYKLYVKRHYGRTDLPKLAAFFRHPLIAGYFSRNKWKSKGKLAVYVLLKLRLTALLYRLVKLYY